MQVCPSCKRNQKNLILHIEKSNKCKDNVSKEEMKMLKDQSEMQRKLYMRKLMKERRRKARENTNEKKQDEELKDQEVMIDTENKEVILPVPKRCPICNTQKKNMLLHIKTKKSCFEKIDKKVFEEWSKMATYKSKRVYQIKFNKRGGHNRARERKKKMEQEEGERKWELKITYERQKRIVGMKFKKFNELKMEICRGLSAGKTPKIDPFCRLHGGLIQKDYSRIKDPDLRDHCPPMKSVLNEKESHAWVENINAVLLEAVISFQIVVCVPSEIWVNAVKSLDLTSTEETKSKLFTLIGNLQAIKNENTQDIQIPSNFKSTCKLSNKETRRTHWIMNEKLMIENIENIIGKDINLIDEEVQKLLEIKEEMENLYVAMAFAAH